MRRLRLAATCVLLFCAPPGAAPKRARKSRQKPVPLPPPPPPAPLSTDALAVQAWVAGMVANGTTPEALSRMVARATGDMGEAAEGARTNGLPKHAMSADVDPRLHEPLMSKDAITASWGWYSGSLREPAELPREVIEQYRDHGHVVLRGFFNPRQLDELRPLLRETAKEHEHEWEDYMTEKTGNNVSCERLAQIVGHLFSNYTYSL